MADHETEERAKLEKWLNFFTPQVKKQLEILHVSSNDLGFMLHIDVNGRSPKKFYPMLSRRAASSENNTVPRITVADTLIGCIIGYNSLYDNFFTDNGQGYEINAFNYTFCLKPSAKLVYDVASSNEHWLVGYSKETVTYVPFRVGTFFAISVECTKKVIDNVLTTAFSKTEIAVELKRKIKINSQKTLEPGHYLITYGDHVENNMSFDRNDETVIKNLSEEDFLELRRTHAPQLSLEHVAPLINKW